MPEAGPLGYLVGYMHDIGEAQYSGSGMVTNSWMDIKAWADLMGIILSPFEVKALRFLSVAYVGEYYRSDGKEVGPPRDEAPKSDDVEKKIISAFSAFRSSDDGK